MMLRRPYMTRFSTTAGVSLVMARLSLVFGYRISTDSCCLHWSSVFVQKVDKTPTERHSIVTVYYFEIVCVKMINVDLL
jgi:hypothetical protein